MQNLNIGIAGLGSVGAGLIALFEVQNSLRLSGKLIIGGVSARTRNKPRPVDISSYQWFEDPISLAKADNIDVFVELIGGDEGPARLSIEAALTSGKHVVTGNKALIAKHGKYLSELAKAHNVDLLFEAAVAGGVPIVRVLRDSLSGTRINKLSVILNGTCNYLTTEMQKSGREYNDVLHDAQAKGYAEADPFLDVSGTDAAQKLGILSALAFSANIEMDKVSLTGVDKITLTDLQLAQQLNLEIKLVAQAESTPRGVVCRVEPVGLSATHPLANVHGTLNAVIVEAERLGEITLIGHGAGAGPTASAVMGDIAKLFNASVRDSFGRADHHNIRMMVEADPMQPIRAIILIHLKDEPGALAQLTEGLAQHNVSVDRLVQNSADAGNASPIGLITHIAARNDIATALNQINTRAIVKESGKFLPVL